VYFYIIEMRSTLKREYKRISSYFYISKKICIKAVTKSKPEL